MSSTGTNLQLPAKPWAQRIGIAAAVLLTLGTMLAVRAATEAILDTETIAVVIVTLIFLGLLAFTAGYSRARGDKTGWLIFLVWCLLLISEEVFSYNTDIVTLAEGNFSNGAYAQAAIWLVATFGLFMIVIKHPQYLRGLFSGDYKWVSWIAVVSVLSCAYALNPKFSLAWALKLALGAVILHVCARQITEVDDLAAFLKMTIIAMTFLIVMPTLRSLLVADPSGTYGTRELEQRFREGPTGLSAIAGTLAVMCMTLYSARNRKWPLWVAGLSLILMIVAGGKAGIIVGIVSGIMFYAMQKRVGAVIGYVAVISVILIGALLFTPLGDYLQSYQASGEGATLSGRTALWAFVTPAIKQSPIIGHGFISSRFLGVLNPDMPWKAGHMHNGLVEAMYNNGLIGLTLILLIHGVIVRNLRRAMRAAASAEIHTMAVGAMAVWINLFLNGMFNATFAGRPDAPYLILIATVIISIKILQFAQDPTRSHWHFEPHTRAV